MITAANISNTFKTNFVRHKKVNLYYPVRLCREVNTIHLSCLHRNKHSRLTCMIALCLQESTWTSYYSRTTVDSLWMKCACFSSVKLMNIQNMVRVLHVVKVYVFSCFLRLFFHTQYLILMFNFRKTPSAIKKIDIIFI